jgi:hypothetical protein
LDRHIDISETTPQYTFFKDRRITIPLVKTITNHDLFDGFHQRRRVNFTATQLNECRRWRRVSEM